MDYCSSSLRKTTLLNVSVVEKCHYKTPAEFLVGPKKESRCTVYFILMCIEGVPWQRAASAQPLILYVATQDILGSLEEHGKRHTRDVALLRGGHLVAERKLQERLETHLRKLLPHPHINLCLCQEKTIDLIGLFCWRHSLKWFTVRILLSRSTHEEFDGSYCWPSKPSKIILAAKVTSYL